MRTPQAATELTARRVAITETPLIRPYGEIHVRWIALAPDGVRLNVVIAVAPDTSWNGAPDPVKLRCSGGRQATGVFRGGGDGGRVGGCFETNTPLALDASWIEIDGVRVELGPPTPTPKVAVEPVATSSIAVAYLWQRLANSDEQSGNSNAVRVAAAALVAAGAIDRNAPELTAVEWVSAARDNLELPGDLQRSGTLGRPPVGVPRAWRSTLDAAASPAGREGPVGLVPIGVITPSVDGVRVAANVLQSGPYGFKVHAEAAGLGGLEIGEPPFAFWARDDLGRHYRGVWRRATGPAVHRTGEIVFPALDRLARELTLMPTGLFERVLIPIPLAWVS